MGRFRDRGFVAYGTAKAALAHMTRLLAADCAPKVRVNAVAPGSIATSALEIVLTDQSLHDEMVSNTPLRRLGVADDIALAVLYLASDAASLRHRQDPRGRRRHRGLQPRHAPPRPLTHLRQRVEEGRSRCNCPSVCPRGPARSSCAQLAEDLGYDRVWLFDSAALYEDIWIWMALLAEHTEIDLGTAVLVPNLRHVMTTASAIADGGAHGAGAPGVRVRHRGDRALGAEQARALVEDHPPLPRAAARAVAGRHRRRRR